MAGGRGKSQGNGDEGGAGQTNVGEKGGQRQSLAAVRRLFTQVWRAQEGVGQQVVSDVMLASLREPLLNAGRQNRGFHDINR